MIYLDCAATSLQKPPEVSQTVARAVSRYASPGRGDYRMSVEAAEKVYETRILAADLFHMKDENGVIFTSNATHALNIAIKGFTYPGDEVVISCLEHNAVVRPIVTEGRKLRVAYFPADHPEQAVPAFQALLSRRTRCVVCILVSNVFGTILPCGEIGKMCAQYGIPFVVDASQAAGSLEINPYALYADAVCMPGHKGLMGPQGTGLLLLPTEKHPRPLMEGGTGSLSAQYRQPEELPDKYESGTLNVPGILGLGEGIKYVKRRGEAKILSRERELIQMLSQNLAGSYIFPSRGKKENHAGLIALQHPEFSCEDIAEKLAKKDVAVRSGLCCASLAHRSQNTFEKGIIRISVSDFNTPDEMQKVGELLLSIKK